MSCDTAVDMVQDYYNAVGTYLAPVMQVRLVLALACIPAAAGVHAQTRTVAVKQVTEATLPLAVRDPVNGLWYMDPPFTSDEPYLLMDRNGLVIGGGTLRAGAAIDLSALPAGHYVLRFSQRNQVVPVDRE